MLVNSSLHIGYGYYRMVYLNIIIKNTAGCSGGPVLMNKPYAYVYKRMWGAMCCNDGREFRRLGRCQRSSLVHNK